MKQMWIHLTWAGVAAFAFTAGYICEPADPVQSGGLPAADHRHGTPESSGGQVSLRENAMTSGSDSAMQAEADEGSRATMKSRFFDALYTPNPLDRKRRVIAAMEGVTYENWQGMIDSFGAQTIHTGRRHDAEWDMALRRAGEIAGSVAVEKFLQGTGVANNFHAAVCLEAWAARHPKEAIAWFQSDTENPKKGRMVDSMVNGLSQGDPAAALGFVESLPPELRLGLADELANGLVQHNGIQSAMEYVERAARSGDMNYTRALFEQVGEKVFFANWVGQTPEVACRWVADQLGQPYMTPRVVGHAAGDYALKNPEAALDWLQKSVAESAPAFLDAGIGGVMMRWQDNTKIATWLETHPDHPLRDTVTRHFSWRLGPIDAAATEQWIATIQNEAVRKEAMRELQERRR